jgi:hypothetical protein
MGAYLANINTPFHLLCKTSEIVVTTRFGSEGTQGYTNQSRHLMNNSLLFANRMLSASNLGLTHSSYYARFRNRSRSLHLSGSFSPARADRYEGSLWILNDNLPVDVAYPNRTLPLRLIPLTPPTPDKRKLPASLSLPKPSQWISGQFTTHLQGPLFLFFRTLDFSR